MHESEEITPPEDSALLAQSLPGHFRSEQVQVNGTRLHYVVGGQGEPLVLLPGWPQTWWQYHKVMPSLATRYQVIAVDLRGMGDSDKPQSGYDKRTMAGDIHELVGHLGYREVNIAGHDIGAMVAFSFAVNYPAVTRKVALLDVAHPDESYYQLLLLPRSGQQVHMWWFAFNQVRGLPEHLLAGRYRYLIDWLFDHTLTNPKAIDEYDRRIYERAYAHPDAIRSSNGWYQAFGQDIEDQKAYGTVNAPMLMLASEGNYEYLNSLLPGKGNDVRVTRVAGSGHYLADEQPAAVVDLLAKFFG